MVLYNQRLKKLEDQFNHELLKADPDEIENYLTSLLKKILQYAINGDSYNYNLVMNQLNNDIVLINSRVKNFKIIYDGIKLKVLREYVINELIAIPDEFIVFNNTVCDLETYEFQKLFNLKRFKDFEYALDSLDDEMICFGNDKYKVVLKNDIVTVYDSICDKTRYKDRNVIFELYTGDVNVLKQFVTKNTGISDISVCKEQRIFNKMKQINCFGEDDGDDILRNLISSHYENDDFIVNIFDDNVVITNKNNNKSVCLYWDYVNDYMDLLEFFKYCIGYENLD